MGLHASMQQLDSDNEQTAVVLVNITASAPELEVTAITVTTSIVEDLTPAAIDQPEVCSFRPSSLFFSPFSSVLLTLSPPTLFSLAPSLPPSLFSPS